MIHFPWYNTYNHQIHGRSHGGLSIVSGGRDEALSHHPTNNR